MVRKSSSAATPSSTTAPAVSTKVSVTAASASAPTTVDAAVPKKAAAKKVAAKSEEAVIVAAPSIPSISPESAVPSIDAAPITDGSDILLRFVEFSAKLQTLSGVLSATRAEFKLLEKQVVKELKKKVRGKNRKMSGNRQPSGFIKPTKITDELASFLGKPIGIEMARTEVSREINNYIKLNNLKDPENGRNINPDDKLSGLLKLGKEDKLTYFNLQKFMKHHFIKETVLAASI